MSQDFLSHIYIILENSEICNKVLTILKNIAILLLRSGKLPSASKIHKQKERGLIMKKCTIKLNSIDDVKEFCAATNKCEFEVDVQSGRYAVDAKSIMGIFSLDLTKEIELVAHADSDKCEDFFDEIGKFIAD